MVKLIVKFRHDCFVVSIYKKGESYLLCWHTPGAHTSKNRVEECQSLEELLWAFCTIASCQKFEALREDLVRIKHTVIDWEEWYATRNA